jgi:transcriptional regulator with XRE-family HTH domain
MTLGEKLRHLRREAGITFDELARRCGLYPLSVRLYERGAVVPSLGTARVLARALGVGLAEFEDCELPVDARNLRREKAR